MPAVRITWTDRNADEEGHRIYRDTAPIDTENLPAPLVELGPGVTSYDDETAEAEKTYHYLVTAYKGDFEAFAAEAVIDTEAGPEDDFTNAQIGDEIGGGIYAGVLTFSGTDYHIVAAKAVAMMTRWWKTTTTSTPGTGSNSNGLANTQAMEAAGLADHPAAEHCLAYRGGEHSDWYLPARDELTLLYNNLRTHPEFTANNSAHWWSSTEYNANAAHALRFSDGAWTFGNKTFSSGRPTRPIRRVPVNP